MIDDLLLGASLVPTRDTQTIETISPDRLADVLGEITGWIRDGRDPLANDLLGALGYEPDQPLVERLFRLSLLSLPEGFRAMLLNSKFFLKLLGAPLLLAEAWYATTGQPLPTIAGLIRLGDQLNNHLWIRGFRAVAHETVETWRNINEGIGDLIRGRDVTRDQVRAKLEQLTAQWGTQLQDIYHAVQADISGMPVSGHRAQPGQPVHWVSVPAPPAARQELWQDLNQHGPAVAALSKNRSVEFVYVRAELAGDRRVFTVTDPFIDDFQGDDSEYILATERIQASDLPGTYLFLLPQAARPTTSPQVGTTPSGNVSSSHAGPATAHDSA
jgi:hypothetical protein